MSTRLKVVSNHRRRLTAEQEAAAFAHNLTLARAQSLGVDGAKAIELPCLIHFDLIDRNEGRAISRNFMCFNVLTAALVGKVRKIATLEKMAINAYNVIYKANQRDPNLLRLTTGEYKAVRDVFKVYFPMLPFLQVGMLSDCARNAHEIFEKEDMEMAA